MIYVALSEAAAIGALVCLAILLVRERAAVERQAARERGILVNQLLHLAGKPWQPAPARERAEEPEQEPQYAFSPSQFPDDYFAGDDE